MGERRDQKIGNNERIRTRKKRGGRLALTVAVLVAVLGLTGCGELEDYLVKELEQLMAEEMGVTVEEEVMVESAGLEEEQVTEDGSFDEETAGDGIKAEDSAKTVDAKEEAKASEAGSDLEYDGPELTLHDIWPTGMPPYTELDGVFRAVPMNAEVSSTQEPYLAAHYATDQDSESGWISADGDSVGAWIYIEFPTPFTISEILVEQGDVRDFYAQGRAETIEVIFDDGTSTELWCKFEDMNCWSQEITPKTTSSVKLVMTSVYQGTQRDNVVINELAFLYNSNSIMASSGDAPVMTKEIAQGRRPTKVKAEDFTPTYWEWAGTGYDAQDIDNDLFRVGKWVSEDGNTVLYVDFASSPDYMDYSLYYKGMIVESYAEMNWTAAEENGYMWAKEAYDEENDLFMEVLDNGKIRMLFENEEIILTLKRAKY